MKRAFTSVWPRSLTASVQLLLFPGKKSGYKSANHHYCFTSTEWSCRALQSHCRGSCHHSSDLSDDAPFVLDLCVSSKHTLDFHASLFPKPPPILSFIRQSRLSSIFVLLDDQHGSTYRSTSLLVPSTQRASVPSSLVMLTVRKVDLS